jgi:hypothetical protein
MSKNPYLESYPQEEVELVIWSGSVASRFDSNANLILDKVSTSLFSSSISIPIQNTPTDPIKVESKYNIQFTEL